jgi:glycosyltransferase involved in cell wall biosynthesis
MIKICFFHLKAHAIFDSKSDAPIGGTLVQMHVVAKKLSENHSFPVSFLVGDFGQLPVEECGKIKVYKSIKLKRDIGHMVVAPFLLWSYLKKMDADVYITSSASPEVGLVALFCKIHRRKMIYRTAHEWDCNGSYAKSHGFLGKIFEYGIKNASIIVTQSDEHKKLLNKNYLLDSKVIKNSFLIPKTEEKSEKRNILWVSRCESWKNPRIFLELAERFSNFPFVMICPKQKYQEDFFEQIKLEARKIENLTFIEFVPFEKIQPFFDEALVFVGTSDYEGFPNTFLQACMGRTPIISYKVNPDNFIEKNKLGYFANGDRKKLEDAIRKLVDDKNDWYQKSKNAFKYLRAIHDVEKNIKSWISIINP